MCPTPANRVGLNNGQDPDGKAPNIFAEANSNDQDCNLPTKKKKARDLDWSLQDSWDDLVPPPWDDISDYNHTELKERSLEKRARDKNAILALCSGTTQVGLIPQTYSGYRTVAKLAGRGFISVAKPLICGAVGLATLPAAPAGEEFVTEHVFEKQQWRNALQWMFEGKVPGGGVLKAGKVAFNGLFDQNGVSIAEVILFVLLTRSFVRLSNRIGHQIWHRLLEILQWILPWDYSDMSRPTQITTIYRSWTEQST